MEYDRDCQALAGADIEPGDRTTLGGCFGKPKPERNMRHGAGRPEKQRQMPQRRQYANQKSRNCDWIALTIVIAKARQPTSSQGLAARETVASMSNSALEARGESGVLPGDMLGNRTYETTCAERNRLAGKRNAAAYHLPPAPIASPQPISEAGPPFHQPAEALGVQLGPGHRQGAPATRYPNPPKPWRIQTRKFRTRTNRSW